MQKKNSPPALLAAKVSLQNIKAGQNELHQRRFEKSIAGIRQFLGSDVCASYDASYDQPYDDLWDVSDDDVIRALNSPNVKDTTKKESKKQNG